MGERGVPERIGPFEIVRRIGAGGMAEAFEGRRRGPGGFEQRVCVKRILPSHANDAEIRALFKREARISGVLAHKNVVRVVDFGVDGGEHFLALELVDGVDLRRLIVGAGPLPANVVALIGRDVAAGLEHVHTRRTKSGPIVHRDVTPANILISVDGDVKLTDFGIARSSEDRSLTHDSFVRGNVWYMAPELLDGGGELDVRSDLFSLGAVLYQCASGRRPYEGRTPLSAMRALTEGRRVPLREAAPSAPGRLVDVVEQLLSASRAARCASAAVVADALAPLADGAARRSLAELVRARTLERPQAMAKVETRTVSLREVEIPAAVSGVRPALPFVPPRWKRYSRGPRAWATFDAAMHERAIVGSGTETTLPACVSALRGSAARSV